MPGPERRRRRHDAVIVMFVPGPLVDVIKSYPTFVASMACFERIQAFLVSPGWTDYRNLVDATPTPSTLTPRSSTDTVTADIELDRLVFSCSSREIRGEPAIALESVTVVSKEGGRRS